VKLELVCDVEQALVEACGVARMEPKHPRLRILLPQLASILNRKLCLAFLMLTLLSMFSCVNLPNSTEPHERGSARWDRQLGADLVCQSCTFDKLWVRVEGDIG
jgi:hypothetical protein